MLNLLLCSYPFPAHAIFWQPTDKKDCLVNYAASAKTKIATARLRYACNNLFKEYTFSDIGLKVAHNPKTGDYYISNQVNTAWIPAENHIINSYQERVKEYADSQRKEAKCVINLDALYNAGNDQAAMIIIQNSECYDQ